MEKSEDVKACMERVNMSFFQGIMAPSWYKEISDMCIHGTHTFLLHNFFEKTNERIDRNKHMFYTI